MTPQEISIFYSTCPDLEIAEKISRTLLEEKLVACTNIIPAMQSFYWWEGKIETSKECLLLLKTQTNLRESLYRRYESLHPYQIPCLLEIPLESGNAKYLHWLSASLK